MLGQASRFMSRLLITTACRKANIEQPSGYLYVLDLDKGKIVHRGGIIEPPHREVDPNPRGGFRGGKGIALLEDQIFLANTVGVFQFDCQWGLQKVISHPSCSGIHEILLDRDHNLWVTSARNDLLFRFDLDGNMLDFFHFRRHDQNRSILPWAQQAILTREAIIKGQIDFRDPRTHSVTTYDSAHVNSISQQEDGSLLVSLGLVVSKKFSILMKTKDFLSRQGLWLWVQRINQWLKTVFSLAQDGPTDLILQPAKGKSIILRIIPGGETVPCLVMDDVSVPGHSVLSRSDGTAVYLNTTTGEILHFRPGSGEVIAVTHISRQFLRGVAQLSDDELVLGSQNNLLWFSLSAREVKKQVTLSDDPNEAVFDLLELPDIFSLPPLSFEAHLGRLIGFDKQVAIFR